MTPTPHGKNVYILEMLSNGKRPKDIAADFEMSVRTVESRLNKMMVRHHAKSSIHLVAMHLRKEISVRENYYEFPNYKISK